MIEEPDEAIRFSAAERALLLACAIVGVWLFSFWFGYEIGTDLGHDIFGSKG